MGIFSQPVHTWRDPDLVIRIRELSLLVDGLERRSDVDAAIREQVRVWLTDASNILEHRFFDILPYDRYDAVWSIIDQLRHLLCAWLPPAELLALLADIRASSSYLSGRQCEACERELVRLEQALLTRVDAACSAASGSLQGIRAELEIWSRRAAAAREAHWRTVNLLRKRLMLTGFGLLLLLVAVWCLLPDILVSQPTPCTPPHCPPIAVVSHLQIAGVMLFGAIGGLVSALWSKESLDTTSSQFYLQRTLLALKPIIGAATATFAVLLQKAGTVSLLPANIDQMSAYLVLAFLAGFSERFVRTRIEAVSNSTEGAASKRCPAS